MLFVLWCVTCVLVCLSCDCVLCLDDYDVGWLVFFLLIVCDCVCFVCVSLCGVFMVYYELLYGVCLCQCLCVRVGFNVFVWFYRNVLCDVAWFVVCYARVVLKACVCFVCDVLFDVVCFLFCVLLFVFVCGIM